MRSLPFLALFLVVGALHASCAEHKHGLGRSREIILHNRVIDTTSEVGLSDFSRDGASYYYVTFKARFAGDVANVNRLAEEYGLVFDSYYPMTTWTVYAFESTVGKLASHPDVLWIGEVPPADKLPEGLDAASPELIVHWAKAPADFPALPAVVDEVAARMATVFAPATFAWSAASASSNTAKLTVAVGDDTAAFRKMVRWLLTEGSTRVKFIDPLPVNRPHSAFATHVVVDGTYSEAAGGCPVTNAPNTICNYPTYLGNSLDGTGEVITIVDSGVDLNNCLFFDDTADVYNNYVPTARKVVFYSTTSGDRLDNTGHGSFAIGLAAAAAGGASFGSSELADAARFNGVAPGAKIAVSDVQVAGSNTLNFDYTNIGSGYLDAMYQLGSRIAVFPWGAQINLAGSKSYYSGQDQAFDLYARTNSDFLLIAPVGNNGLTTQTGRGRIDSPSSAKNVLGVGGSFNAHSSFTFTNFVDLTSQAQALHVELCTIGNVQPYSSTVLCSVSGQNTPCPQYQNVLCFGPFSEPTPAACCNAVYTRPQCCPASVLQLWSASTALFSEFSGYPQSSRGPTYDFRIKPDVVAPAQRLYSAAASSTSAPFCGAWSDSLANGQAATVNEGTSFSAGVAAGAAAIVRQWLREGYYPFGDPTVPGSLPFSNPSSALIKAILVNGADSLFQYNSNNDASWKVLSSYIASEIQGHGRINLRNNLQKEPNNIAGINTVLIDRSDVNGIQFTNDTHQYYISVPSTARGVKVTLVWTDREASIGAGRALVNDLDVVLVRDDGYEYRANRLSEFDYNNNVEQIEATFVAGRRYSIYVHGTFVPRGPQSYALVVSGDLICGANGQLTSQGQPCLNDPASVSADARCPMDCSLRTQGCAGGVCFCSPPYYGLDCSLTPCPNNCNNNGECDGETGVCTCNDFWRGTDCSEPNPTGIPPQFQPECPACDSGVDIGITIGVCIGSFFLGLIIAFPLGVWLATHLMLKRKKKMFAKMRAAQQHAQHAAQPLHDNIEHDSEDE